MKSSKAEAETRSSIQEKIAALEDNTSLLKDYSWLSQVCSLTLCFPKSSQQTQASNSNGTCALSSIIMPF